MKNDYVLRMSFFLVHPVDSCQAMHYKSIKLLSSGKGKARKGNNWLVIQKALKLKPLPIAYKAIK